MRDYRVRQEREREREFTAILIDEAMAAADFAFGNQFVKDAGAFTNWRSEVRSRLLATLLK
jgi:hypothetical protein